MGKRKGEATTRQYAPGRDAVVLTKTSAAPDQGEKRITTIEDLPIEVMSKIMCTLSTRDVVRASSMCKQWMHLPGECITDFYFYSVEPVANVCPVGKDSFINMANQIVHRCTKQRSTDQELPISSFEVTFCLDRDSSGDIDSWVRFTISNGVKHLTLSLTCKEHRKYLNFRKEENYIFPCDVLNESPNVLLQCLSLQSCIFGSDLRAKCTNLEELRLKDTTISDSNMQNILCCCPNLKRLSIDNCYVPAKITITSELTFFMAQHTQGLREIKFLDSRDLAQIQFSGKLVKFNFPSVPKLTDFSFLVNEPRGVTYVFRKINEDFPSMDSLTIYYVFSWLPSLAYLHGRMTAFQRIQVLRFYSHSAARFSLLTMLEILKASPLIRRFEMVPPFKLEAAHSVEFPIQAFHKSLKFVQVSGFCGTKDNVDLVKLLIQASAVLEHLTIEFRPNARNFIYKTDVHDGRWHGDEDPETVKRQLGNLMARGSLVFK